MIYENILAVCVCITIVYMLQLPLKSLDTLKCRRLLYPHQGCIYLIKKKIIIQF